MYTLREKTFMASKWLASFTRRDWSLSDYPVHVRPNGEGAAPEIAWIAQILNWPGPAGIGATKEGAVSKLRESLESIRKHRRSMPRPGRHVAIEFAPTTRVASDITLHDDFIIRILGFAPGSPVFISDQSSLSDFGDEAYVAQLKGRISEIYGVDVSDMKEALLCDVLERIQKRG
jgi:hypothetical protein